RTRAVAVTVALERLAVYLIGVFDLYAVGCAAFAAAMMRDFAVGDGTGGLRKTGGANLPELVVEDEAVEGANERRPEQAKEHDAEEAAFFHGGGIVERERAGGEAVKCGVRSAERLRGRKSEDG